MSPSHTSPSASPERKARAGGELRTKFVVMAREGVGLARHPETKVDGALKSIAMSAMQAGWSFADYVAFIDQPSNHLAEQARVSHGKVVSDRVFHKRLGSAWSRAAVKVEQEPAFTPALREQIIDVAEKVFARADLDAVERAICDHAIVVARRHGTTTPALPRDATAAELGVGQKAVRLALDRLVNRGLLSIDARGHRRVDCRDLPPRSTTYRLPTAQDLYKPEVRNTGPSVPGSTGPHGPDLQAPASPVVQAPVGARVPIKGAHGARDRDKTYLRPTGVLSARQIAALTEVTCPCCGASILIGCRCAPGECA